jgi:hypothetical protein
MIHSIFRLAIYQDFLILNKKSIDHSIVIFRYLKNITRMNQCIILFLLPQKKIHDNLYYVSSFCEI